MKRHALIALIAFNLYAISIAPTGVASTMWSGVLAYSTALKNACIGPSGLCTAALNLATAAGQDIYRNATSAQQPIRLTSAVMQSDDVQPKTLASVAQRSPNVEQREATPPWCQENMYAPEQAELPVVQEMNELCRSASFEQ